MAILDFAAIREAQAAVPRTQEIDIPEWGGAVVIRRLSKAAGDGLIEAARRPDGTTDTAAFQRALVTAGLAEPDLTPAQLAELWADEGSMGPLNSIIQALIAFNDLSDKAVGDAERRFRALDADAGQSGES